MQPGPSGDAGGPAVYGFSRRAPGDRAERGQLPRVETPGQRAQRPPNVPRLGDWNTDLRGPDRDRARQQWRQHNRGWDAHAPWRRDRTWWRHNDAFRWFHGYELGYFFIPAFGYIEVPTGYEHHNWIQGDYLPSWFWRFRVDDYWNYGLPEPPYGCIWVWVDNDIALIDASDGYILDIVHNVW